MPKTSGTERRLAYFVSQTIVDENGQIVPCIALENEPGYYRTNWTWGTDLALAEECAAEKNSQLGLTLAEANRIVLSSMGERRADT